MPNPVQLLGGPGRPQRQQQIMLGRVSANQPLPESPADPLYVVILSFSIDHFWRIDGWPELHGTTLPEANAEVLLIRDDGGGDAQQQQLRCVWWANPNP